MAKVQILNNSKRIVLGLKFIISFIRDLGGVSVFVTKIIEVFNEGGAGYARDKSLHILSHAGLIHSKNKRRNFYAEWLHNQQVNISEYHSNLLTVTEDFRNRPLISVIMSTYNANSEWLREAIESVVNQVYTNWELCIADDASDNAGCLAILRKYENFDERIKIIIRTENGNISEAMNSAMSLASGEWLCFLDHDDMLSKDALFWIVERLNKYPKTELIYSDEDKIDYSGNRKEPHFKPEWNYHLLLAQNYICHLSAYKRSILYKIGGFRKNFDGSQDYDLLLRYIEIIDQKQIIHIPYILYHWRMHEKSTSTGVHKKINALMAGQKAVNEHLKRTKQCGEVKVLPINYYRVKWCLPEILPRVNIIIPTRNNGNVLKKCINSILEKTVYSNYIITIINNDSDDFETLQYFSELSANKQVRIINDLRPFNYSAIMNYAVGLSDEEFICMLNDDTEIISPDWLNEMMRFLIREDIGAVGAKLWYPNDTIQHAGVILGLGGVAGHSHKHFPKGTATYFRRAELIHEVSAVTGACTLFKKSIFEKVNGLDEINLRIAFNDVDFCLKIRELGYKVIFTPFAELYHHESLSRGNDFSSENYERFNKENNFMLEKWKDVLKNDPSYSPNLSLKKEDFSICPTYRMKNPYITHSENYFHE